MVLTTETAHNPYQLIGPLEDGSVGDLLAGLELKQSRQRLHALIAQWLRMENLVVLTGAGTSVSSGGQTMDELERTVLSVVRDLPDISPAIQLIVNSRIAVASDSRRLSFENWLSFVVNALHVQTVGGSPFTDVTWKDGASPTTSELEWCVTKLTAAVFAECALVLADAPRDTSSSHPIPPHLAFLAKLVARESTLGRAHLFTLNYDTLFEQALELLGIQYFDGFTGRADARFDPSVYGLDIYYPGEVAEGRVRRFDKFLHLYKLHGSIHWRLKGDEVRARHPDLTDYVGYAALDPPQKALKLPELGTEPLGILPTANKFAKTLTMPFAHLFRAFQLRLSIPQTFLLVLGYGFSDEHINRIVETALTNPSLVMLVVEPNPLSVTLRRVRRYKELGRRAFVLSASPERHADGAYQVATFDDFARAVMPDVQWLDDFLRLRRFEKQIQTASEPEMHSDSSRGSA